MELRVTEVLQDSLEDNVGLHNSFDKIPENSFSTKIVKKNKALQQVKFTEPVNQTIKPIPKQYAKMTRPHIPSPKSTLSYDDILSKMGMCVYDGKLHLMGNERDTKERDTKERDTKERIQQNHLPQQNYIYNKYFKDQVSAPIIDNRPKNAEEYKNMLIKDIIQQYKIKQIKSTKLIMPTSNIHMARSSANLNKFFDFSKR